MWGCNLSDLTNFHPLNLIEEIEGQWQIGTSEKYYEFKWRESQRVFYSAELEDEFESKLASKKIIFLQVMLKHYGETIDGWIRFTKEKTIYTPSASDGSRKRIGEEISTCLIDPRSFAFSESAGESEPPLGFREAFTTPKLHYREVDERFSEEAKAAATIVTEIASLEPEECAKALDRLTGIIADGINNVRLAHTLRFRFHHQQEDGQPSKIYKEREFANMLWGGIVNPSIDFLDERAVVIAPALERLISTYLDNAPRDEQIYHDGDDGIAVCDPFTKALLILDPDRLDVVRRYVSSLDREHCVLEGLRNFVGWTISWARKPGHIRAGIYSQLVDGDNIWTQSPFLDAAAKVMSGQQFFDMALAEVTRTNPNAFNGYLIKLKDKMRHRFDTELSDAMDRWISHQSE